MLQYEKSPVSGATGRSYTCVVGALLQPPGKDLGLSLSLRYSQNVPATVHVLASRIHPIMPDCNAQTGTGREGEVTERLHARPLRLGHLRVTEKGHFPGSDLRRGGHGGGSRLRCRRAQGEGRKMEEIQIHYFRAASSGAEPGSPPPPRP